MSRRVCVVCSIEFEQAGRGAPRKYCPEHRPANLGHVSRWYQEHREYVREYQWRRRDPITRRRGRDVVCEDCLAITRTYLDGDLCHVCRHLRRIRKPDPICRGCGQPFRRKGSSRPAWCRRHPECFPPPEPGGHGSDAYKKARKEGHQIIPVLVFKRDKWHCHLCGERVDPKLRWPHPMSASLDHVQPISKGGSHEYFNVALAHLTCNRRKGARKRSAS